MSGGAISLQNYANTPGELSNIAFFSNNAYDCGGALYSDLSGKMQFTNIRSENNSACSGGALCFKQIKISY
jgi:predicted outer membrane repeat protein